MRPLALRARGYRSFVDLDYRFVDGATAVVGENGAGKSSLIGAVDLALFGPRGRSLEPYVRENCDEMMVELAFEHGVDTYRVRRGWARGKSTLDFEYLVTDLGAANGWKTLTQGSAADTQTLLEQTIGLTRTTFQASGYLAQRASDTFTGAQPKDRKRLLADALALDAWQTRADAVAADRRAAERRRDDLRGQLEPLAAQAARATELEQERADLTVKRDIEAEAEQRERAAAEEYAARAHDLEAAEHAWAAALGAVDIAAERERSHLSALERTAAAREQRDTAAAELAGLAEPDDITALEQQERELVDQQATYEIKLTERRQAISRRDDLARRADNLDVEAGALRGKAEAALATVGETHCDTCGQTLGAEAAQTAAESWRLKAAQIDEQIRSLEAEHAAIVEPPAPDLPDTQVLAAVRAALADGRQTMTRRAHLQATIAQLDLAISETDNDDYRDTARRLAYELEEARRRLAEIERPGPGAAAHARSQALQLKAAADARAANVRVAGERLAAVAALLEQARAAAADHARVAGELAAADADLVVLDGLEQAFGRDGIPAWIVEAQALPQIETEANAVLARLGGAVARVELRTERETKTGKQVDALDIICHTQNGERALETFSGGEQSRAEIALALGLVELLQARQAAELRFLALDEPSGLDSQGTEALAELLRERGAGRVVLLASHDPNLRDQFDQAVLVEAGPSGSRVLV